MATYQLNSMQLPKEIKSVLVCGPQEGCFENRCEIQDGGQEMVAIVQKFQFSA